MKAKVLLLSATLTACVSLPGGIRIDPYVARVGFAIATMPSDREPINVDNVVPTSPEDSEPTGL